MANNPQMPRRRFEVELLPTQDGRVLLESMVTAVGLKETARRLARTASAVRLWRRGRVRVPEVVRQWLLTAATNTRGSGSLYSVVWLYPRPRPAARAKNRMVRIAMRDSTEFHALDEEMDFPDSDLDPYA